MTTTREELVFADCVRRLPRSRVDLATRTSRLLAFAGRPRNPRRTGRGPYRAKRAFAPGPGSQRRDLGHRSDGVQPQPSHPAVRTSRHHLVPKRRAGLQASQGTDRQRSLHYSRSQTHAHPERPPASHRHRRLLGSPVTGPKARDQFHIADRGELPPPGGRSSQHPMLQRP